MFKKQSRIVAFIGIAALSSLTMLLLLWRYPLATCIITLVSVAAVFFIARTARLIETDALFGSTIDTADFHAQDPAPKSRVHSPV